MPETDERYWDAETHEACPPGRSCRATPADPHAHVSGRPCSRLLVPADAAMTLMRGSRIARDVDIETDEPKARALVREMQEATARFRPCVLGPDQHGGKCRTEDGEEWDPYTDDDEPDAEPAMCDHGMVIDPDTTPGGPRDPRRTCGASGRDTAHRVHSPHPYDDTASGRARAVVEESEARLCGCSRPDMSDDPHRHDMDDWCHLWRLAYTADTTDAARRAWMDGRLSRDRIDLAKRALVQTQYFTADEVSDDVAPRIMEMHDDESRALQAAQTEAEEMAEAIRLTVEYVGTDTLPPRIGWSWYDALLAYRPDLAAPFRDAHEARHEAMLARNREALLEHAHAPLLHEDDGQTEGPAEPFDLRPGLTQITVRKAMIGWRAEVTFRGMDLADAWGWTADKAEAAARAMVERERRRSAERARTTRVIEIEEE